MDLSKTLEEVQLKDKADETRVKNLLEMSAKKYNLQKELDSLEMQLSLKEKEVKKLKEKLTILSAEIPVLEKQEEVVKHTVQELIREIVNTDADTEKVQDNFWNTINSFVSGCNWFLTKQESSTKNGNNNKTNLTSREREHKIRQLKLESELEAMHLYEKYQNTKMEELKLIKDLLGKESYRIGNKNNSIGLPPNEARR